MSAKLKMPLPTGIPATNSEVEKLLLQRLAASTSSDLSQALRQLVRFYESIHRNDLGRALIQAAMERTDDPEISSEERIRLYTEAALSKSSDSWTRLESFYYSYKTLILRTLWTLYVISIPIVFYKSYVVNNESLIFSIVASIFETPLMGVLVIIAALAATLAFERWRNLRVR